MKIKKNLKSLSLFLAVFILIFSLISESSLAVDDFGWSPLPQSDLYNNMDFFSKLKYNFYHSGTYTVVNGATCSTYPEQVGYESTAKSITCPQTSEGNYGCSLDYWNGPNYKTYVGQKHLKVYESITIGPDQSWQLYYCQDTKCQCGTEYSGGCGSWTCKSNEMYRYRTCSPSACSWEKFCVGGYSECEQTPPPTCKPNWQSGAWGACVNNAQTREVKDLNNCGISQSKPSTTQSCTSGGGDSTPTFVEKSCKVSKTDGLEQREEITITCDIKGGSQDMEIIYEVGVIPERIANEWELPIFSTINSGGEFGCCPNQENINDKKITIKSNEVKTISLTTKMPYDGIQDKCMNNDYWDGEEGKYSAYAVINNKCSIKKEDNKYIRDTTAFAFPGGKSGDTVWFKGSEQRSISLKAQDIIDGKVVRGDVEKAVCTSSEQCTNKGQCVPRGAIGLKAITGTDILCTYSGIGLVPCYLYHRLRDSFNSEGELKTAVKEGICVTGMDDITIDGATRKSFTKQELKSLTNADAQLGFCFKDNECVKRTGYTIDCVPLSTLPDIPSDVDIIKIANSVGSFFGVTTGSPDGFCIATKEGEGFDLCSLPHFDITKNCQTDVLIIYLGGIVILFLLLKK